MNSKAKILFLIVTFLIGTKLFSQVNNLEKHFKSYGLVNIQDYCTDIKVDLAYSSTKNFVGLDMYKQLNKCYLPKEVALQLCKAQALLHEISDYYNIIIFDATRPLHIQKLMWDSLKLPIEQKTKYLAHPSSISLHNYGAAVDIGLITKDGVIVDMGTPFDYFGKEAHINNEDELIKAGLLTRTQLINRKLLRLVMLKAGFLTMSTEWWHFNFCTKEIATKNFKIIP